MCSGDTNLSDWVGKKIPLTILTIGGTKIGSATVVGATDAGELMIAMDISDEETSPRLIPPSELYSLSRLECTKGGVPVDLEFGSSVRDEPRYT